MKKLQSKTGYEIDKMIKLPEKLVMAGERMRGIEELQGEITTMTEWGAEWIDSEGWGH
jgi:hypothetical protein